MATSSIFENFAIHGDDNAQRFALALEESVKEPVRIVTNPVSEPVSEPKKILELFGLEKAK